jgi:hypothetical protein
MDIEKTIKGFDKMLKDETLPLKMREDLERKKKILLNDKAILK